MIENKRIEEASRNVRQYVTDGLLKTRDDESKKLVPFFMDQAEKSLRTASVVFELSTDSAAKDTMKLEKDFESHMWVIVISYYSMFYAALALLASQAIRAGRQLVHKVVADALIHFFISNKRVTRDVFRYRQRPDTSYGCPRVARHPIGLIIERTFSSSTRCGRARW